jgi:hypothetical protein
MKPRSDDAKYKIETSCAVQTQTDVKYDTYA